MKIAMVGTGYVGLVSGVCLSDFGHEVVCVDRDAAKIARLQAGEAEIVARQFGDRLTTAGQPGPV
ncbi:MAG: UDP-glucose 6-dehydrogenase, partial [Gemmobacter sp.]